MSRYITLDKNHHDYKLYLSGRFSKTEVALPVPLIDGTQWDGATTFKIINVNSLHKQPLLAKLFRLMRLDMLGVTFFPAFGVCVQAPIQVSALTIFNLFWSLFFIHAATFAFNDYFDHMQGRDRLSETSGRRVIQTGALRAYEVLRWAWVFWSLAFVGALFLSLQSESILFFAALGALLGALGSMYRYVGLKKYGFSDLAVLIAYGPLLTLGAEKVISKTISLEYFLIGLVFGSSLMMYSQMKNIMMADIDYQAQIKTLAVRLGFDRMKKLIQVELILTQVLVLFLFRSNWWLGLLFFTFSSIVFFKIKQWPSPFSGQSFKLADLFLKLHFVYALLVLLR